MIGAGGITELGAACVLFINRALLYVNNLNTLSSLNYYCCYRRVKKGIVIMTTFAPLAFFAAKYAVNFV